MTGITELLAGDITTQTAPWWFVPVLAGVVAIVSTALGALISLYSSKRSDNRREQIEISRLNRDEARVRASDVRRGAVRLIVECRAYEVVFKSNFVRDTSGQYILDTAERNDLTRSYEAYWELLFLSNEDVGDAARKLLNATRRFEFRPAKYDQKTLMTDSQFDKRHTEVIKARGALYEAVMNTTKHILDGT